MTRPLDDDGMVWAQDTVWRYHYRHRPVPAHARPQGWAVRLGALGRVGCLLVGRPRATRSVDLSRRGHPTGAGLVHLTVRPIAALLPLLMGEG